MDKANGLTRITRYVTFVGRVRMTDHLTKEMRYKPLLLDVMFRRMMEGGRFLEASPDARQERSEKQWPGLSKNVADCVVRHCESDHSLN